MDATKVRAISRAWEIPLTPPLLRIIIKNDQRQIDSMSNDSAAAVIEPDSRAFGESARAEGKHVCSGYPWVGIRIMAHDGPCLRRIKYRGHIPSHHPLLR
jgi:hypothetical protein